MSEPTGGYGEPPLRPVIKETLLSRKPHPASGAVAVATLALSVGISVLGWRDPHWGALLAATPGDVFERHEMWRLVSTMLLHRDAEHLLANALPLTLLAHQLFGYFGRTVFPLGSLLLGIAITAVSLATYPYPVRLVGASGLVYGMAGFWLTMFLFLDRSHSLSGRWLRAVGFTLVMLVPSQVKPDVSYRTHAIGLALGILYGLTYFALRSQALRRYERVEWE